ncbi:MULTISPECIES: RNA polymerase sigma factor [Sphingobacterium]|uniref:RNA polymerase sigma-70 factor (ECF subfamily) n=1 Tax=Sphingobacterium detergens TaxID=1145106 RepID=A0A420B7M1_SPHD1|nr:MULTISPECIES: RNA polymerase sigma-70 factor [Sphingobacterium]MCS4228844.1 RNA polymerase sigma-70 factor (ECF subfamily) [Sphingobacterium sp. BIGb0165]RKE52691.1 RNA polymerase sigma-70 factor (ECF subfamily) [Sphingobacterium detergens]
MYKPRYDHIEEKENLLALRSGCQTAFRQIYTLYSGRIYLNIRKMVKSEQDAAELLQEVFIKVWDKRELIDPEQSFRSYLFQIAKYTVYNFIRKNNLEKQIQAYLSQHNTQLYSHVEEQLDEKQDEQWLSQTIEQLPPQRRLIYKLCKIEGKSYAEVSTLLRISTSTINDHIVKATKYIKERHGVLDKSTLLIASFILLQHH